MTIRHYHLSYATLLLVTLCLALGALDWTEYYRRPAVIEEAPAMSAAAPAWPAKAAVETPLDPKSTYVVITERPLFTPLRRPPRPDVVPAPTAAPQANPPSSLQPYTLVGIVSAGAARIAVVKPPSSQDTLFINEGTTLQGWTAAKIEDNRVVFRANSNEYIMELAKNPPSAPPPASTTQPQSPPPAVNPGLNLPHP